jgi:DNA-binding response OmpR family regulator
LIEVSLTRKSQDVHSILIIDDDPQFLDNLVEGFELEGYRVFNANNGTTGLGLANEHIPDIILCGIHVPQLDGLEILKRIRNSGRTVHIPFVFCSGFSDKKLIENALSNGADDYLIKPCEFNWLIKRINDLVQSAAVRKNSD